MSSLICPYILPEILDNRKGVLYNHVVELLSDLRDFVGKDRLEAQERYHKTGDDKDALLLRRGKRILYSPYPKQVLFHKSQHLAFETLYGGAAGGGKSFCMLFDAYMNCIRHPGTHNILFRRTFPQLEKSLIFLSRTMFDITMGKYNQKERVWRIYTRTVPSYIHFGHCKNQADVYNYHSTQFDSMYFDELTHFTEFQYAYLLTRLRPNVAGAKPYVKAAANPGGIGHAWVRRRWRLWDKTIHYQVYHPDREQDDTVAVPSRCFIPAFVTENKWIMENDPGYVDRLKAGPFKKQLYDGDWSIFSGQAFPEIAAGKHFMKSFKIPLDWPRWVSLDYGYSRPFSAHWHAQEPGTNRIYTYKEIYGVGIKEAEQARRVIAKSIDDGRVERILYHVADPSVFSPRGGGSSIAQVWQDNGLTVVRGNRDRKSGKARVHSYLAMAQDGKPHWIIFNDMCPNLARTLPDLVLDESDPEDVDCFVAGTPVETCRGTIPVEQVRVGDFVPTPIGPRRVVHAGVSGASDTVCTVSFSDGRILRGTANHKVAVVGRGLVELQDLRENDILFQKTIQCEVLWKLSSLFIKAFVTIAALAVVITSLLAVILNLAIRHFIDKFILTLMVRYPRAFMSTTRTITVITTFLRIWSRFLHWLMLSITTSLTLLGFVECTRAGSGLPEVEEFFARTLSRCSATPLRSDWSAVIVGVLSRLLTLRRFFALLARNTRAFFESHAPFVAESFFRRSLALEQPKPVRIVAVGSFGKENVYRLTVDEAHLYYANGFLVTNTTQEDHAYDDCRYFLMSIQPPPVVGTTEEPRRIDAASAAEWDWYKKNVIQRSAMGNHRAIGSEINDVR